MKLLFWNTVLQSVYAIGVVAAIVAALATDEPQHPPLFYLIERGVVGVGGTSAVAPLWAALLTRLNQLSGTPSGLINPKLYQTPTVLRDITSGNNGDFEAAAGWDACTGLGSPNGAALRSLI